MNRKKLIKGYEEKKAEIKQRLEYFRSIWEAGNKKVFAELCFCLCTPQSKARVCDKAITNLENSGLLFSGTMKQIRDYLVGVRFPDTKALNILEARKFFLNMGDIRIKEALGGKNPKEMREWLVKNVRGFGYKEASHFLRNVGFGGDLAILDRHILKNLKELGVIDKIPESLTGKQYLEIEGKMRAFSKDVGIPFAELDLLLWSQETGEIFK